MVLRDFCYSRECVLLGARFSMNSIITFCAYDIGELAIDNMGTKINRSHLKTPPRKPRTVPTLLQHTSQPLIILNIQNTQQIIFSPLPQFCGKAKKEREIWEPRWKNNSYNNVSVIRPVPLGPLITKLRPLIWSQKFLLFPRRLPRPSLLLMKRYCTQMKILVLTRTCMSWR